MGTWQGGSQASPAVDKLKLKRYLSADSTFDNVAGTHSGSQGDPTVEDLKT